MNKQLYVKNNIMPQIKYDGLVTVFYTNAQGKKRKITHHNEGKIGLFNFITRALVGEEVKIYRPTKIKIFYKNTTEETEEDKQATINPIYYGSGWNRLKETGDGSDIIAESAEASNSIQYVFLINNSNIINEAKENGHISKIILYNEDDNLNTAECAELKLSGSGDEFISLNTSDNLLIYWQLKFTNNITSEETL